MSFLINDPKADMRLCPFGAPGEPGAGGGRAPAGHRFAHRR